MFERYTESARRAIFFARYEACAVSESEIDTVDLLRGIVRESKAEDSGIEWFRSNWDRLCEVLWKEKPEYSKEQFQSRDIKLSSAAKIALAYTAQISNDNPRWTIDTPTLLLGVLSFENDASNLLKSLGLNLEDARTEVRQLHQKYPPELPRWSALGAGVLRSNRIRLFKIVVFVLVMFGVAALMNWINR